MLVLSRHAGEEIWLYGGKIKICINSVTGGKVKIGIEAPDDCPIMRRELITTGDPAIDPAPLVKPKELRGGI